MCVCTHIEMIHQCRCGPDDRKWLHGQPGISCAHQEIIEPIKLESSMIGVGGKRFSEVFVPQRGVVSAVVVRRNFRMFGRDADLIHGESPPVLAAFLMPRLDHT